MSISTFLFDWISMIYHLSNYLMPYFTVLNVVHYVSFRAIMSLLTALMLSLMIGEWFIDKSKIWFRSRAREWAPQHHKIKDNMPTMGGIFILIVTILTCLLWCDLSQYQVWIFLVCLLGFGIIGACDDWYKIKYHAGISARTKFISQVVVAVLVIGLWLWFGNVSTTIVLPFFKNVMPNIGWLFVLWALFIIIGCSNAVNLTDGLDGLAIGSLIPNFATFALVSYLAGHYLLASYLHIPFAGSAELTVVCSALVGVSLGFLWYNAYPAQIFMGDVGSLALGAGLAIIALMTKQELLLAVSGGLFVVEVVTVIMQVLSYKLTGKRIFKMAPIHHHFELLGWKEAKITVRFGIISLVLCLLALVTLKLR